MSTEHDHMEDVDGRVSQLRGYCLTCKTKKAMSTYRLTKTKNGQPLIKGKCITCGTKMCKFITKSASKVKSKAKAKARSKAKAKSKSKGKGKSKSKSKKGKKKSM